MYKRKKKASTKDTLGIEGAVQKPANKGKYGAKKVVFEGITFDSTMEFNFFMHLRDLKEKGEVLEIELQPLFLLQEKFRYQNKAIREINYKSDFKVTYADGSIIIWDVKGMPPTADFLIKWKMVKYLHQDMTFRCVKSTGRKPNYVWETLKI